MKKYLYCALVAFLSTAQCWSAITIKVDPAARESFPFPVLPHVFDGISHNFFVGAHQPVNSEEYKHFALSFAVPNDSQFKGITPEKVMLDKVPAVDNPMHGAEISLLSLLGRRPIAVLASEPQNVYIVQQFVNTNAVEVLTARDIKDAEGNVTSGVIALTSNATGQVVSLPENSQVFSSEAFEGTLIFAGVKKAGGVFGQKGGGIALITVVPKEVDENGEVVVQQVQQERAVEDTKEPDVQEEPSKPKKFELFVDIHNAKAGGVSGNIASPLDPETPAVFINNPVAHIEDFLTFHNSFRLGMYIGLQAAAGAGAQDGVRSLVRGHIVEGGKLVFSSIAPDSAFDGTDEIVGALGADQQVSMHRISSMLTSTWLDYLIVIGGNGTPDSTRDQVYALPMVGFINPEQRGVIANKNSIPVDFARPTSNNFLARSYQVPATQPSEMPKTTDLAARVGGGPLGMVINDIFVTLDTVFVAAGDPANGQQPGVFYSQAVFDQYGRISNWTPWQRTGAVDSVFGIAYNPSQASFTFMSGADEDDVRFVKRTQFGSLGISNVINPEFPQESGGVQGLVEFPFDSQGFSTQRGDRLSVRIWQGDKKVFIQQVGADDNNDNFGPISPKQTFISEDGSLNDFVPDEFITNLSISGGDLSHLGPIRASELLVVGQQGYFVVGGFGGVAVLAGPNGNGFDAATGLMTQFIGLNQDFAFKKIGNFKHVRKLIASGELLYVITDKTIERVHLTPQGVVSGNVDTVVLTDGANIPSYGENDSISDCVISNGFGIIASSAGVYYAFGLDQARNQDEINFVHVGLDNASRSSTRLIALGSKEGFDKRGMVLVLNAYVGLNQARIYRLVVNSDNKQEPVKKVPDLFYINQPATFFVNIGIYRNFIATDGASTFLMRSKNLDQNVIFEMYSPGLRSGLAAGERQRIPVNIGINGERAITGESPIDDARAIGPMIKSVTTGQWLILGDFGVRGNG